jgi:tetratricopeptide (TPR) repeat protein
MPTRPRAAARVTPRGRSTLLSCLLAASLVAALARPQATSAQPDPSPAPVVTRAIPSSIPGAHREPNPGAQLEIARTRSFMGGGRIADALAANLRAAALDSLSSAVFETLGITYQTAGRAREAYAAFRRAALLDPSSPSVLNRAGQVLLSQLGLPAGARAAFRQALAVRPGYAPAHYSLGAYHLLRGEVEEAEAETDSAYDLATADEEQAAFFGARMQLLMQRGQYASAADALSRHIFGLPSDWRSRQAYALALRLSGQTAEAAAALHDLIGRLGPQAVFLNELGTTQLALGERDSAEIAFRSAWERDSTASEAGYHLAVARLAAGDTSGALAWLGRVEQREPGWFPTALLAWRIHEARGDAERARRARARAEALNPFSYTLQAGRLMHGPGSSPASGPESLLVRAESALLSGDFDAAAQLAGQSCLDRKLRPAALLLAAWVERGAGGLQGGRVTRLEAALEGLAAGDARRRAVAERELGVLHLRLGNRADAVQHLERALAEVPPRDPLSAPAAAALLRLYAEAGDARAAAKLAGRVSDTDDADLLSALAGAAEAGGDAARARALRERAQAAGFLPS